MFVVGLWQGEFRMKVPLGVLDFAVRRGSEGWGWCMEQG